MTPWLNVRAGVARGTEFTVRRGSISREQADIELRLADAKKSKAFENTAYALSCYEKEMTAENIHAEAKALLEAK